MSPARTDLTRLHDLRKHLLKNWQVANEWADNTFASNGEYCLVTVQYPDGEFIDGPSLAGLNPLFGATSIKCNSLPGEFRDNALHLIDNTIYAMGGTPGKDGAQ